VPPIVPGPFGILYSRLFPPVGRHAWVAAAARGVASTRAVVAILFDLVSRSSYAGSDGAELQMASSPD
jgi:hypothetical protein